MKALWAMAFGGLVGFGVAAEAGEYTWQPATAASSASPCGVSLGRPTPLADAVSLSPPVVNDPSVRQISYTPTAGNFQPLIRLQNADSGSRLVPQATWARMPSAPESSSSDFAAGAQPITPGPIISQFTGAGPVQSQPLSGFACGDGGCGGTNCCDTNCCGPTCCGPTCCGDPCCCCPDPECCPVPPGCQHWYTSGEYLLWFIRGTSLPPLVTANPPGTPVNQIGTLPSAVTLFGGNTLTNGPLSGGRFRLGYWFDDCRTCGLEGGFFFLAPSTTHFLATPTAALPNIGRPFFDPNGQPDAEVVAATNASGFPSSTNILNGAAGVTTRANFYGAELNYRQNLFGGGAWRIDGLAGFRFLNLSENLTAAEENTTLVTGSAPTYGTIPAGFRSVGVDSFSTQNQFYGGQVGYIFEYQLGKWVVNLRNTLAVGNSYESIQVSGGQYNAGAPGTPAAALGAFPGNLLTERTNIGLYTHDRLSFVPEVGLNLGYQVTENLRLFVGYNFLLWTNVVRPGDQIDQVINANNAPPPLGLKGNQPPNPPSNPYRPMPLFNSTNFWAQGVNIGLQYKF